MIEPEDITPLWPEELDDAGWIEIAYREAWHHFRHGCKFGITCGLRDIRPHKGSFYCTRTLNHLGPHVAYTYNHPDIIPEYLTYWPRLYND